MASGRTTVFDAVARGRLAVLGEVESGAKRSAMEEIGLARSERVPAPSRFSRWEHNADLNSVLVHIHRPGKSTGGLGTERGQAHSDSERPGKLVEVGRNRLVLSLRDGLVVVLSQYSSTDLAAHRHNLIVVVAE